MSVTYLDTDNNAVNFGVMQFIVNEELGITSDDIWSTTNDDSYNYTTDRGLCVNSKREIVDKFTKTGNKYSVDDDVIDIADCCMGCIAVLLSNGSLRLFANEINLNLVHRDVISLSHNINYLFWYDHMTRKWILHVKVYFIMLGGIVNLIKLKIESPNRDDIFLKLNSCTTKRYVLKIDCCAAKIYNIGLFVVVVDTDNNLWIQHHQNKEFVRISTPFSSAMINSVLTIYSDMIVLLEDDKVYSASLKKFPMIEFELMDITNIQNIIAVETCLLLLNRSGELILRLENNKCTNITKKFNLPKASKLSYTSTKNKRFLNTKVALQ